MPAKASIIIMVTYFLKGYIATHFLATQLISVKLILISTLDLLK